MNYTIRTSPQCKAAKIEDVFHLPAYVVFADTVKSETAKAFREQMAAAEKQAIEAGQKILPVVIDTFGGDCYAMFGMADAIRACSIPVATIVEGKAMSAGALLFSCGADGHRYIGRNATVMIHEAANMIWGKNTDLQADAKETERLNTLLLSTISLNIAKDAGFIAAQIHERNHADWYLTPEDCVAIGLANRIGIPAIQVDISITHAFN